MGIDLQIELAYGYLIEVDEYFENHENMLFHELAKELQKKKYSARFTKWLVSAFS